ncbi:MAG: hypothetical protein U0Y10_00160 [Spirosomataceae bacterium]
MKNVPKLNLKTITTLFFTAFLLASCSKDTPEPSMGDQHAGTYVLTKVSSGSSSVSVPSTNPTTGAVITGKIDVTKVADDKITGTLTLTETDKTGKATNTPTSLGEVTLKKATTGEIEGYQGSTKMASYTNNELSLFTKASTGETITIIGKK